jgi:hypothetical protein
MGSRNFRQHTLKPGNQYKHLMLLMPNFHDLGPFSSTAEVSEWDVIELIHTLQIVHNLVLFVQAHSTDWLSPEPGENVKTIKVGSFIGVNLYSQIKTHILYHFILVKEI